MAIRFEEATYTETKTGHRTVYVCDSCGKEVSGEVAHRRDIMARGHEIPDWFWVSSVVSLPGEDDTILCSLQCVKEWALQPEAVPA